MAPDGTADMQSVMADVTVDESTGIGTYSIDEVAVDYAISAVFSRETYTIAATVADYLGTISPHGDVTVDCGTDKAFTIVPHPFFHILNVRVDGVSIGPVSQYTFVNVTSDHTIHATFKPNPIELVEVYYDVVRAILTFKFTTPVLPQDIDFQFIGMELNDSGQWDMTLSQGPECPLQAEETQPSSEINVHLICNVATTATLGLASVQNSAVDILLKPGVFTNIYGAKNLEVSGTDDFTVKMMANDLRMGLAGDVNGDGEVDRQDGRLILRSTVSSPEDTF